MNFSGIAPVELECYLDRPEVLIIDLREPQEYRECHIRGAVNIPFEQFWEQCVQKPAPRRFASLKNPRRYCDVDEGVCRQLEDYEVLLFYCGRGSHSLMVAERMRRQGWPALSITGGMNALTQSHFS
ncbi:MAG: rhodanese-like domain-containing protein [Lachnospiraceae bacterium]